MSAVYEKRKQKKSGKSSGISLVCGVGIAGGLTAAGLLAGAWLLDQQIIQSGESQYITMVFCIASISVLLGSAYAAHTCSKKPITIALGVGICYVVCRILIPWLPDQQWQPDVYWWMQSAVQIFVSGVGGILGQMLTKA